MAVVNDGKVPTFFRGRSVSFIDVTLMRGVDVSNWKVLPDEGMTLYKFIYFELNRVNARHKSNGGRRLSLDKSELKSVLREQQTITKSTVKVLTQVLKGAQRASCRSTRGRDLQPYW